MITSHPFFRSISLPHWLSPSSLAWIAAAGFLGLAAMPANSEVVVYPQPATAKLVSGLKVEVDGKEVWVESQKKLSMGYFSFSGLVKVRITRTGGMAGLRIRPDSRGINPKPVGNTVEFTLSRPENLQIQWGNSGDPFLLFANPLEKDVPSAGTSTVKYFGPGVHRPGNISLGSGQTVYIAGGAVVYGRITGSPSGSKIRGRGVLDGSDIDCCNWVIDLRKGKDILIEGIIVRNAPHWSVVPVGVDGITMDNIKVLNSAKDGIDPLACRNVIIRNSFIRSVDDAIAVKHPPKYFGVSNQDGGNILVENTVLSGYNVGDGFTIGFELKEGTVKNVTVRNCDVLKAVGGSAVGGHSAFSIIVDGAARIEKILFDDIRVEEEVTKNFEIQLTDGNKYPKFGKNGPGHVKDVELRNIRWAADKGIILKGYNAAHQIENVSFVNCTVAGKPLKSASDAKFTQNAFVKNVTFSQKGGTVALKGPVDDGLRKAAFKPDFGAKEGFQWRFDWERGSFGIDGTRDAGKIPE